MRGKLFTSGLAAGLVTGFFGGAGGSVLLPLLRRWVKVEERRAFANTVAVIAPLCALLAGVVLWRGELPLRLLWPYLLGGALGGAAAGQTLGRVPVGLLRRVFGLILIVGGLRLCW